MRPAGSFPSRSLGNLQNAQQALSLGAPQWIGAVLQRRSARASFIDPCNTTQAPKDAPTSPQGRSHVADMPRDGAPSGVLVAEGLGASSNEPSRIAA